jgi:sec-independent protein translocase protein TatA
MRWGFWEIILIVLLVVVLFGSAKIPSMMKNVADGVKVFKKEVKSEKKTETTAKKSPAKKKTPVKK